MSLHDLLMAAKARSAREGPFWFIPPLLTFVSLSLMVLLTAFLKPYT